MANEDQIVSVIDVQKTQKQIDQTIEGLTKVVELIDKANQSVKGSSGASGLANAQKDQNKAMDEAAKLTKKLTELETQQSKENAILKERIRQKTAAQKEEINSNAQIVGAMKALETEVKKAERNYKNLAAEIGITSKEAREAKRVFDDLNRKMVEINRSTGNFRDNVGNYTSAFDKIKGAWVGITAAWGAAMAAGSGVISIMKQAVEGAMADERAEKRLQFALNGSAAASERMLRFKERMMASTLFSEDEIMGAVTMGLELGRTELQTRKMFETAAGLSRVTGMDLNSAMLALNATYEGQTGKLGKLAGDVKGLTESQLKNGDAVEILNKKYGKFAGEGLNTMEGSILQMKKYWSEALDDVGFWAMETFQKIKIGFTAITAVLGGGVNTKATNEKKLESQRQQIKDTQDNIAVMRAQAKADQNRNIYLEQLNEKEKENNNLINEETEKVKALKAEWESYVKYMKAKASGELVGPVITQAQAQQMGITEQTGAISKMQSKGISTGITTPTMTPIPVGANPESPSLDKYTYDDLAADAAAWNQKIQIAADAVAKIDSIVNQSFQNRINALDMEAQKDEEAKQRELEAAGNNATAIRAINDKYDAKEKEREKEKRRLQKEQAKYQKTSALISAIINTALGVTAALANPGGILGIVIAALAAATGIAQIALIASQPLPSYRKGRKGGPAEFANINEAGQEAIVTRSGETFFPSGSVAFIPAGADVIPHHELVELGGRATTMRGLPRSDRRVPGDQNLTAEMRNVGRIIKDKKETHINITERGMQKLVKNGNTWEEWVNDRVL